MAVVKISIYVARLDNVLHLFDKLQVWRSETGEEGVYFELTGAAEEAATLTGINSAPFNLNGETLEIQVDGESTQTLTFACADPINVDDTNDLINDGLTGLTATEDGGRVKLTSDDISTSSVLEIMGGTALSELGFSIGDKDVGLDEWITLSAGQETYAYDDQSGAADYWYKTRYYNSVDQNVSGFGDPVRGDIGSILPAANLIKGVIDIAEMDGKPSADRRVIFYNVFQPPIVIDDIGVFGREIEATTDLAGHTEVMLVRGAIVDITISGTGITRRITVPDTGGEFAVMGAVADADDIFEIQVPLIPYAVRRI